MQMDTIDIAFGTVVIAATSCFQDRNEPELQANTKE
jgi:hypothetical protein